MSRGYTSRYEEPAIVDGDRLWRGCVGKVRYPSRNIARGAIRVLTNHDPVRARGLHPYRCRFCKKVHIGH